MSEEEFLNNILNWNKEDIVDKAIKLRRELLEKREEIERLNNIINELSKENQKLKDNWNTLKEWLESNWEESQDIWFVKIINKMQEIEQGSDKVD